MSTQYRLVQSGKTASGGCSAGQGSSEPVAPRILFYLSDVTSTSINKEVLYFIFLIIAKYFLFVCTPDYTILLYLYVRYYYFNYYHRLRRMV
jgi:hypothetical protein